jgi:hypothetical protein
MQAVDFCRYTFEPLRRPFDFRDTGEEGQHIALLLLSQRAADGGGHFILDPGFGLAPDMTQFERPGFAFAFDYRSIHQPGKAPAVERCRHRDQPQIGPQTALCIEREGEAEIAVEAAFVDFIEKNQSCVRQFWIILNAAQENALGQH